MNNLLKIIILLFTVLSCDTDKYLSSNLNVYEGIDSTIVSGRVLRADNRRAVENATVQIGYERAKTNNRGYFELGLQITNDDNRNLAMPIIVIAPKYKEYYGQFYNSHLSQDFEFELTWRPPIIYDVALLHNDSYHVVQALVKDFEGFSNIGSVICIIYLLADPGAPAERHELPMRFQFAVGEESAFYQSDIFYGTIPFGGGKMYLTIAAADKYSYTDTLVHIYYMDFPDPPIYPVDWGDPDKWPDVLVF